MPDKRLAESEYAACGEDTNRGHCDLPVVARGGRRGVNIEDYPNVKRWFDEVSVRPAAQQGVKVPASEQPSAPYDAKSWHLLFSKPQFQRPLERPREPGL